MLAEEEAAAACPDAAEKDCEDERSHAKLPDLLRRRRAPNEETNACNDCRKKQTARRGAKHRAYKKRTDHALVPPPARGTSNHL